MPDQNAELIQRFYDAFQRLDGEAMAQCYAPDVQFSDPVFGTLRGREAGDMWRMLLARAEDFTLHYSDIAAIGQTVTARWVAGYRFSQTGRIVVNRVESRFAIRDGLIFEHHDTFDLYRWSRQALGLKGVLLGWTPFVKNRIRTQARRGLNAFRSAQAQP
jgi:ketosteroid isomerase-like protein